MPNRKLIKGNVITMNHTSPHLASKSQNKCELNYIKLKIIENYDSLHVVDNINRTPRPPLFIFVSSIYIKAVL